MLMFLFFPVSAGVAAFFWIDGSPSLPWAGLWAGFALAPTARIPILPPIAGLIAAVMLQSSPNPPTWIAASLLLGAALVWEERNQMEEPC